MFARQVVANDCCGRGTRSPILAASVMWTFAGIIALAGSGYKSFFGPLKGGEFQFYTIRYIDQRTAQTTLYNPDALHRLQT